MSRPVGQSTTGRRVKAWPAIVRRLTVGCSLAAGFGVIAFVAVQTGADLHGVWHAIPFEAHAAAAAAACLHFLLRGARLVMLSRGIGARLRLPTSTAAQFAGEAGGAITPSCVGALPAKVLVMRRDRAEGSSLAVSLLGEALAEVAGLLVVAGVLLLLLPAGRLVVTGALYYAVIITGVVVCAWWLAGLPHGDRPPRLLRLFHLRERRWARLRSAATRFRQRAVVLRHLPRRTLAWIIAASVGIIAVRCAILPMLVAGVVGPHVNFAPLVAWPLLLHYMAALLPPPSGGGVVEIGFVSALGSVLPREHTAGLAIWWRFYTFYLGALVGSVVLVLFGSLPWSRRRPRPALDNGADTRLALSPPVPEAPTRPCPISRSIH